MRPPFLNIFVYLALLLPAGQAAPVPNQQNPGPNADAVAKITSLDIEPVWTGHPVGFALLTHADQQFAAYYDANRQMSVAQRTLGSREWKITKLDSHVGWDSHNSITMVIDREGYLHLSGNMHVNPLVYFRSSKPLDGSTLVRIPAMIGRQEKRCTYPTFLHTPENALVFTYRDGRSGEGDTYYNVYDEKTKTWKRLTNEPIFDGRSQMNAYPMGPKTGPDGYYHLSWVWRDSPNAETNHDLSYARSKNLRDWETADGKPIQLPISIQTPGVIVDPIPKKGGILNGASSIGFDLKGKLVIAYHKFDSQGNTQAYFARFEDGAWKPYQATNWDYRWYPHGGGSLVREIRVGALEARQGKLRVAISHPKAGSGTWAVDPETMRLTEKIPSGDITPPDEFNKVTGSFPGLKVMWAIETNPEATASNPEATVAAHYRLRWEALGPNRDLPRREPWPDPVMLKLVVLP